MDYDSQVPAAAVKYPQTVCSQKKQVLSSQIKPAPFFGASVDMDFILGMDKVNSKVIMLLDIERLVTGTALPAKVGGAPEVAAGDG